MQPILKCSEALSNKTMNVVHMPGTVLLLMFWASWSPPCHMPMTNNQVMMIKNRKKWGKKVRIVALSMDKS